MRHGNILLSLISLWLLALQSGSATSSSDNDSGPGVALTREAIALGMEPSTLGELWRTKQPVIVGKTTYKLTPDGQHITSHKEEPVIAPSQPASVEQEQTTVAQQPTNPQSDWEYVPRNTNTMSSSSPLGRNWPNFGSPTWPSFNFPVAGIPQTPAGDQRRTVTTTTTRVFSGPAGNGWSTDADLGANWPAGVTPQTTTKTELDNQGRRVTTVTKTYPVFSSFPSGAEPTNGLPTHWNNFNKESWLKTTNFGNELPSLPTPAAQPVPVPSLSPWPYPFPLPLPMPKEHHSVSRPPLPTADPTDHLYTTTPLPSLEEFLRQTPKTTDTVYAHKPAVVSGVTTPINYADVGPETRDMLDRSGITDEDLENARSQGNDIVRTRVLPGGQSVTTRVHFNTRLVPLPTAPPQQTPAVQEQVNPIDDYLSKVQLTPSDIQSLNGELIKTLVDKNGRVLNVKFVLSTVKGDEQGQGQVEKSTK